MAQTALSLGSAQGLRYECEADGAVRRRVEGDGDVTATRHTQGISWSHTQPGNISKINMHADL